MSDDLMPAINRMAQEIKRLDEKTAELKRSVNTMCELGGRPPMYRDVQATSAPDLASMRRDQFFGVALATAVKQYLEMRGDPKRGGMGAATVGEIYDALDQGGFDFQTKNEDNAKRGLRGSLSKNTAAFTRVRSAGEAAYGLREWYPAVRDRQVGTNGPSEDEEDEIGPDQSPDPARCDVSSDQPDSGQGEGGSEPKQEED